MSQHSKCDVYSRMKKFMRKLDQAKVTRNVSGKQLLVLQNFALTGLIGSKHVPAEYAKAHTLSVTPYT